MQLSDSIMSHTPENPRLAEEKLPRINAQNTEERRLNEEELNNMGRSDFLSNGHSQTPENNR